MKTKSNHINRPRIFQRIRAVTIGIFLFMRIAPRVYAEDWAALISRGQQESERFKSFALTDMLGWVFKSVLDNFSEPLQLMRSLLLYLFVIGILYMLLSKSARRYVSALPALGMITCIMPTVFSLLTLLVEQSEQWNQYLFTLVPVLSGLIAASGYTGTALVYSGTFIGVSGLFAAAIRVLLLPLIKIYLAVSIVSTIWDQKALQKAANLMLRIIRLAFQGLAALLGFLLGAQSLLSAGSDNLAIKTGKFVLANSIPIVGQAASDALGSVLAGLKAVKGYLAFGAVGAVMLDSFSLLIRTLLTLSAIYAGALLAQLLGLEQSSHCLLALVEGIRLMLTILTIYFLLLFFSTVYMVMAGG